MICKNQNSEIEVWKFDNLTNQIYFPNGEKFTLREDDSVLLDCQRSKPFKRSPVSDNKSRTCKSLKIQLGFKCNMSCKYCSQSTNGKVEESSSKDIEPFLKSLKESKIHVTNSIDLWGGEPLVYWKTILKLVPKIRQLYPDVPFKIISNGTLLTKDKVDFMKQYGIHLTLSHDAQGYSMRGQDPLDNPETLEVWKYAYKTINAGINCVFSPKNTDIQNIVPFFREKIGNIHVNIEGPMTHNAVTSEEIMFGEKGLADLQKNIYYGLLYKDDGVWDLLRSRVLSTVSDLVHAKAVDKFLPRCTAWQKDSIVLNLRGDVLACHSYGTPDKYIGRIEKLEETSIGKLMTPWSNRERCSKCHLVGRCMGGCPLATGLGWSMTCKNLKAFHSAIFRFSWLLVTKTELLRVEEE